MISLKLKNRTVTTEDPAFVMAIVNATPDSFWKESRGGIELALKAIEEGAHILDLGAESTRPGSQYVSEEEEIKRLIPLLKEIRRHSDIPVSIDTRKAGVFKACLEEGADISTMAVQYAPNVTKQYMADRCEKLGITVPDDYEAIEAE